MKTNNKSVPTLKKLAKQSTITLLLLAGMTAFASTAASAPCPEKDSIPVQTTPETVNPILEYHPQNPADAPAGSSVPIRVIGGIPPYDWTADNTLEYYLANAQTTGADTENGRLNTLTANANACNPVTVTITDSRTNPETNQPEPQQTSGTLNSAGPLEYAYGETATQEVDRGDFVDVSVSGGVAPYTWTISGGDFSFDQAQSVVTATTSSRSIRVYAGPTACGSTTITVTDNCQATVAGGVRCTAGQWVVIADASLGDAACGVAPLPEIWGVKLPGIQTLIQGKYKIEEQVAGSTNISYYTCCDGQDPLCLERCNEWNCNFCLYKSMTTTLPCAGVMDCADYVSPGGNKACYVVVYRYKYEWQCVP